MNEFCKLIIGIACCLAIMHAEANGPDPCHLAGTDWHWRSVTTESIPVGVGTPVEAHIAFRMVDGELVGEVPWIKVLTFDDIDRPFDAGRLEEPWASARVTQQPAMGGSCLVRLAWPGGLSADIPPYFVDFTLAAEGSTMEGNGVTQSGYAVMALLTEQTSEAMLLRNRERTVRELKSQGRNLCIKIANAIRIASGVGSSARADRTFRECMRDFE